MAALYDLCAALPLRTKHYSLRILGCFGAIFIGNNVRKNKKHLSFVRDERCFFPRYHSDSPVFRCPLVDRRKIKSPPSRDERLCLRVTTLISILWGWTLYRYFCFISPCLVTARPRLCLLDSASCSEMSSFPSIRHFSPTSDSLLFLGKLLFLVCAFAMWCWRYDNMDFKICLVGSGWQFAVGSWR